MGARLLEAYSDAKLDELGDFAPTEMVQELVPKVDYSTPIENWPFLLVQLTRFRCGGICLREAISHTVVDGQAAGVVLGKNKVGDRLRPHLKIRPHPKTF